MPLTTTKPLEHLELNGHQLTVDNIVQQARKLDQRLITLSEKALSQINASNELKESLIDTKQPIYGVTTGFGDSVKYQISPQKTTDLQRNMVRYHLNGTGPLATDEVVRATMLIRSNCLARGNSGVRSEIIQRLLDYLNEEILPIIPERGSVGASGDLVPLCYLAASIIGEGEVRYQDEIKQITDVLKEKKITALTLEAKEGLALINGTSFMTAFAALAVWDAKELAFIADLCTAMASEALLGNRAHFHPFIHEAKPHKGQIKSANLIYEMLSSSQLSQEYSQILNANQNLDQKGFQQLDNPIQDRYSIRCAPQVTGVLRDTLQWVEEWVETESNSTNDNPLFDSVSGNVYNGGNFYGGHIGQAMDSLKVSVANIADLLDRQLELIVDEKFNNKLTPNLIKSLDDDDYQKGLHHGFKGMQLASSAITAEALKMSGPVSVFSRSTEAHNQDKVSMGTISARDARTIIELVQEVSAIHLLALCQAVELRGKEKMSKQTRAVFERIRKKVPFVDRDRRMDQDIKHVVQLIRTGEIQKTALEA